MAEMPQNLKTPNNLKIVTPDENRPNRADAEAAVNTLLRYLGEDVNREGLAATPARVVRAYDEWFQGYGEDPASLLAPTFQEVGEYDEMVLLKGARFYSFCEHHMAPIIGVAHIAYLPERRVVGISKLQRVLNAFARRLQVQERLTTEIANMIECVLQPRGVGVIIEAQHHCMTSRGTHAHADISMVTTRLLGAFKENPDVRREFLALAGRQG